MNRAEAHKKVLDELHKLRGLLTDVEAVNRTCSLLGAREPFNPIRWPFPHIIDDLVNKLADPEWVGDGEILTDKSNG